MDQKTIFLKDWRLFAFRCPSGLVPGLGVHVLDHGGMTADYDCQSPSVDQSTIIEHCRSIDRSQSIDRRLAATMAYYRYIPCLSYTYGKQLYRQDLEYFTHL
jgi:hypothetical protein